MLRPELITRLLVIGAAASLGGGLPPEALPAQASPVQDQAERRSEQARIKFTATPYVNPESVVMVPPRYPPIAKAFRIQGQVVLEVTVGEDGRVSDVRPQSGSPVLVEAAEAAVRQWHYEPSLRLPAGFTVAFEFRLAEENAEQAKFERAEAEHFPDLMMGFTKDSPEYPREALREGVEGQVLLEVVADAEGGGVDVRVLKSENALLTEAAVEVARRPSPDGNPSVFHWKPGRNTMIVDFSLDEPRRLTADSPVPALGYLTSAPLGLLIVHHEFADYPDEAKNTHVQGKVEVRIDAECERGRSQGSGPSWQRALARCGSESRTALAVFTPRLRPQPGNRDLRFSNHRLIDRSESHGPRPTIQMRPARRRRNRSPRDAPRAGRLLQGAGGGERSGRAPPFSVPRILACFFSTSRCPSRTGSTSCVKSRARRTHRRQ